MIQQPTHNRNHTLDVMKGIAIIFIVFDHSGFSLHPVVDHIEVPIFFFISGYLFNANQGFSSFLFRKIRTLIVPYLIFSLLYVIPYSINLRDASWFDHAINLLLRPANYPLWFIKALFWALIIYYGINRVISRLHVGVEIAVSIALSVIAVLSAPYFVNKELLLITGLPQALFALPIIGFGHVSARLTPAVVELIGRFRYSFLIYIMLGLLSFDGALLTGIDGIRMHEGLLGAHAWLFYPCVLFSAGAFAGLCYVFSALTPLRYVGKNSLPYFGLHAIVLFFILEFITMPQPLVPFAVMLFCIPLVELWRRFYPAFRV